MLIQLLSAGNETTASLIGSAGSGVLNAKIAPVWRFSELRYRMKEPRFLSGSGRSIPEDFDLLSSHIEREELKNQSVWIREPLVMS